MQNCILAAALFCLLQESAATAKPPSDPSSDSAALVRQFDERFGALSTGEWVGAWPCEEQSMPFMLQWCRAEFSEYDLMQTKGELRPVFVARLSWPQSDQADVFLSGMVQGDLIRLWEVPLPSVDIVGISDGEPFLKYIQELNEGLDMSSSWERCTLEVEGEAKSIELNLVSALAKLDGATRRANDVITIVRGNRGLALEKAWVGASYFHDQTNTSKSFSRVALFSVNATAQSSPSRPSESWPLIGFMTGSHWDRRLEGEVPSGSLWTSRQQFIRFVQECQHLDLEHIQDPLPQDVQALLRRYVGRPISAAELQKDAKAIFGSWEAVRDAACPFAEVVQNPVFAFERDGKTHVLHLRWYYRNGVPQPHIYYSAQYVMQEACVFHNGPFTAQFPLNGDIRRFQGSTATSTAWYRVFPLDLDEALDK